MDSLQWLAQITNSAAPTSAARAAGVQPSTMTRQIDKGVLSPETVVAIARAYKAPVLPGLVACGLITTEEAHTVAPLGKLLSEADDEELLRELLARVERAGGVGGPLTEPLDNLNDENPSDVHHLFVEGAPKESAAPNGLKPIEVVTEAPEGLKRMAAFSDSSLEEYGDELEFP